MPPQPSAPSPPPAPPPRAPRPALPSRPPCCCAGCSSFTSAACCCCCSAAGLGSASTPIGRMGVSLSSRVGWSSSGFGSEMGASEKAGASGTIERRRRCTSRSVLMSPLTCGQYCSLRSVGVYHATVTTGRLRSGVAGAAADGAPRAPMAPIPMPMPPMPGPPPMPPMPGPPPGTPKDAPGPKEAELSDPSNMELALLRASRASVSGRNSPPPRSALGSHT